MSLDSERFEKPKPLYILKGGASDCLAKDSLYEDGLWDIRSKLQGIITEGRTNVKFLLLTDSDEGPSLKVKYFDLLDQCRSLPIEGYVKVCGKMCNGVLRTFRVFRISHRDLHPKFSAVVGCPQTKATNPECKQLLDPRKKSAEI